MPHHANLAVANPVLPRPYMRTAPRAERLTSPCRAAPASARRLFPHAALRAPLPDLTAPPATIEKRPGAGLTERVLGPLLITLLAGAFVMPAASSDGARSAQASLASSSSVTGAP